MIEFFCNNCSALKHASEAWIVGIAVEAVGAVSARREVNIQSAWTREAAVHPLAVHFCSIECKDEYMARLFGPETPVEEVVVEREVPSQVMIERVVPDHERVVTKTSKTRRKRAS